MRSGMIEIEVNKDTDLNEILSLIRVEGYSHNLSKFKFIFTDQDVDREKFISSITWEVIKDCEEEPNFEYKVWRGKDEIVFTLIL